MAGEIIDLKEFKEKREKQIIEDVLKIPKYRELSSDEYKEIALHLLGVK